MKSGIFAVVSVLLVASSASASAGTAPTGSNFPVTYLTPPPNSVPGSDSGIIGMGYASSPMSSNGRYVLFGSDSDNLTSGYSPESTNLFRKDRQTGEVVLVNRADGLNGAAAEGYFFNPSISADGNLVAFATGMQIDPADVDEKDDIYLRNIQAGTTTLLTGTISEDAYDPMLSADGNYLVFATNQALFPGDGNTVDDVYRMNLSDGTSKIVSARSGMTTAGNASSREPSISNDGAWVAFSSEASNLVAGFVDNNGGFDSDVFVRNVDSNTTHLVSARFNNTLQGANDQSDEPEIAGTPSALAEVKIAFSSASTNLSDNGVVDSSSASSVYLRDMSVIPSELISRATGPAGANADSRAHTPSISDDGSRIVFSSDAENLGPDPDYYGVYLRDRSDSSTHLVSARNSYAVQGEISADGSVATWGESGGATADSDPDLASVFVRSLPSGTISLVSRPSGTKLVRSPAISLGSDRGSTLSADGRYTVFSSWSARLPGGDPVGSDSQIYRRDLKTGVIELVSRASGAAGGKASQAIEPSISSDGNLVAFVAQGSLDPADTNDKYDVYVRNMNTGITTLVSREDGATGAAGNEPSNSPAISGDGRRVAFRTASSNLGTDGAYEHILVRDLTTNQTLVGSRGSGEAGTLAVGHSSVPKLSYDGSRLIFASNATNLSPDDALVSQSIYLRDLNNHSTTLVSRAPGLDGASIPGYVYDPVISGNGSRVAFMTYEEDAIPATAPWPPGTSQIIYRDIADGTNYLGSVSPGGQPGDGYSTNPSFSRDGTVLAFDSDATNLREGFPAPGQNTVVVRDLTTGVVSGPPKFGLTSVHSGRAMDPVVSDNGNCVLYRAEGHNSVSGVLGDFEASYILVRNNGCLDPQKANPKISKLKLTPKKFRVSPKATAKVSAKKKPAKRGTKISFSLNTKANVTIWIDRKVKGRKAGAKCVKATKTNRRKKACTRFVRQGKLTRKNLAAGKRTVAFSGRIGRKALKPGQYRIMLQARAGLDKSNKPARPFRIVRR